MGKIHFGTSSAIQVRPANSDGAHATRSRWINCNLNCKLQFPIFKYAAGADPQRQKTPVKAKQESEAELLKGIVDVSRMDMNPAGLRSGLERHMQVRRQPSQCLNTVPISLHVLCFVCKCQQ
jgi:hypothetical protein